MACRCSERFSTDGTRDPRAGTAARTTVTIRRTPDCIRNVNSIGGIAVMRTGWLPRSLDIWVSSVGLLVVAPVLLAAGGAIWIEDGLPIFYRQPRVGRGGIRFVLFKLRSMFTGLGGPAITSSCDSRVTSVGRWLRKYKLDELPQLWNVLKGDMRSEERRVGKEGRSRWSPH